MEYLENYSMGNLAANVDRLIQVIKDLERRLESLEGVAKPSNTKRGPGRPKKAQDA